jgi:hypothetical protein
MKALVSIAALLTAVGIACAQPARTDPHAFPKEMRNKCQLCHSCPTPTKTNPCLIACPRSKDSQGIHATDEAPDVLLMNKMTKQYGPVIFSHRAHAKMSEMSGGCFGCHHYNDTAMRILKCDDCHSVERKRENVNVPDLKGAYHRLCMKCHRQWTGATSCSGCHLERNAKPTPADLARSSAQAKPEHPSVTIPERKVFETPAQGKSVVTFFHSDHATRFGLKCADCHRNEGCVRCHETKEASAARTAAAKPKAEDRTFEEIHRQCSSCHSAKSCESCHRDKPMAAFDHAAASGWALGRFHEKVNCQKCHGTSRQFTKLDKTCTSCHTKWLTGGFKHAVTGIALDETHAAVDCAECHQKKDFSVPPSCTSCHDDKSFPKQLPGKRTAH